MLQVEGVSSRSPLGKTGYARLNLGVSAAASVGWLQGRRQEGSRGGSGRGGGRSFCHPRGPQHALWSCPHQGGARHRLLARLAGEHWAGVQRAAGALSHVRVGVVLGPCAQCGWGAYHFLFGWVWAWGPVQSVAGAHIIFSLGGCGPWALRTCTLWGGLHHRHGAKWACAERALGRRPGDASRPPPVDCQGGMGCCWGWDPAPLQRWHWLVDCAQA